MQPKAETLDALFTATVQDITRCEDVREQAFRLRLDFARNQFFYDGNKRTGLLMMNGQLMSNGYSPLSIPARRLTEYNAGMLAFYENGEYDDMLGFLRECHEAMYGRFM